MHTSFLKTLWAAVVLWAIAFPLSSQEYDQWSSSTDKAYEDYQRRMEDHYNTYKERIERLWNEYKESTPTQWVEYSADDRTRSTVDFEHGEVTISTIVEPDQASPEAKAEDQLKQQLESVVKEKDTEGVPLLENQLETPDHKPIDDRNIDNVAEGLMQDARVETINSPDGSKKLKYTITLEMTPDHLRVRIDKYLPAINEICSKHKIQPSVVLAMIHTESSFNPRAFNRSSGACGLMQIVPRFAGLAMNQEIYGKDSRPTSEELFDARRNLEMGIGYLKHIRRYYFDAVTDHRSQYYCMISGYNGGSGNVYRAVTGKTRKCDAFDQKVNGMNSSSFLKFLAAKLPHAETRNYLKTVVERSESYGGIKS